MAHVLQRHSIRGARNSLGYLASAWFSINPFQFHLAKLVDDLNLIFGEFRNSLQDIVPIVADVKVMSFFLQTKYK